LRWDGVIAVEDHPFHLGFVQRDRYTGIAVDERLPAGTNRGVPVRQA
jgi:hypothetical protein